jgi:hypothetical protein
MGIDTLVQVVTAALAAVVVFGLGAVFVAAQIIIPTRSTRGAAILSQRYRWPVRLGLGLLALFVAEFWLPPTATWSIGVLVVLSCAYLLWLVRISEQTLKGATDPVAYDKLLRRGVRRCLRRRLDRRGADALYEILRTYRGWIRVAAANGDSRELHVALTGLCGLAKSYAQHCRGFGGPPLHTAYESEGKAVTVAGTEPGMRSQWVSPIFTRETEKADDGAWVAEEMGRTLVRAIESGIDHGSLLERDLARLLDAFHRLVVIADGAELRRHSRVLVVYLTEAGLGVRRCDAGRGGWSLEVVARLCDLHRRWQARPMHSDLATGSAAAVLLVAHAFLAKAGPDRNAASADLRHVISRHDLGIDNRYRDDAVARATAGDLEPEQLRHGPPDETDLLQTWPTISCGVKRVGRGGIPSARYST